MMRPIFLSKRSRKSFCCLSRRLIIDVRKIGFKRQGFNQTPSMLSQNGEYLVTPINNISCNTGKTTVVPVHASEDILSAAMGCFLRKATLELEKFVNPKPYKNKSVTKDEILYFSGRILSTQEIDGRFNLGDAALDLSASTFCVPIPFTSCIFNCV